MKLAAIVVLALLGVAAAKKQKVKKKKGGKFVYEWEYYKPTEVKEDLPKQSLQAVAEYKIKEIKGQDYEVLKWETATEWEYFAAQEDDEELEAVDDPNAPCGHQRVRDCDHKCAPAFWIGNGICDSGRAGEERASGKRGRYNFACKAFWYDGGDCLAKNSRCWKECRASEKACYAQCTGMRGKFNEIGHTVKDAYLAFKAKAQRSAMSQKVVNVAKVTGANVPVLAVAVVAVVAAVAAVIKRKN